jgi:hypothetical protein
MAVQCRGTVKSLNIGSTATNFQYVAAYNILLMRTSLTAVIIRNLLALYFGTNIFRALKSVQTVDKKKYYEICIIMMSLSKQSLENS